MSTLKEDIKSQFKCGHSISTDDDHFLIEPILLPCSHSVCLACLEDLNKINLNAIIAKVCLRKMR